MYGIGRLKREDPLPSTPLARHFEIKMEDSPMTLLCVLVGRRAVEVCVLNRGQRVADLAHAIKTQTGLPNIAEVTLYRGQKQESAGWLRIDESDLLALYRGDRAVEAEFMTPQTIMGPNQLLGELFGGSTIGGGVVHVVAKVPDALKITRATPTKARVPWTLGNITSTVLAVLLACSAVFCFYLGIALRRTYDFVCSHAEKRDVLDELDELATRAELHPYVEIVLIDGTPTECIPTRWVFGSLIGFAVAILAVATMLILLPRLKSSLQSIACAPTACVFTVSVALRLVWLLVHRA